MLLHVLFVQVVSEVTPAPQNTPEEEDDEDESHFSEGQLVPANSQSYSDDSEISEEIIEGQEIYIEYWFLESLAITPDSNKEDKKKAENLIAFVATLPKFSAFIVWFPLWIENKCWTRWFSNIKQPQTPTAWIFLGPVLCL